jgi:hypothetical protein
LAVSRVKLIGGIIMQIQLKILGKGDDVLNTWDNKISIKRKSGEVEIFTMILDEGLPRLEKDSVLITFGKKEVVIKKNNNGINNSIDPEDDIEIITF